MVSPVKTIAMTIFFSRAGRLRGFQLMSGRRHRNPSLGRQRPIQYPSRCMSFKRGFSSQDKLSPSEDDTMGISPELQNCILKFVTNGSLSQEESRSISSALFRSPFGTNLVTSRTTEEMKGIIRSSVESYVTQKAKRAESGRDAIGNPGSYVRSIVKTEVGSISDEVSVVKTDFDSKSVDASSGKITNSEETRIQVNTQPAPPINRQEAIGVQELRELLRLHLVEPNELSENCMHVLSQHPTLSVKYALETYAKQKKRREENKIDKIAYPSSYIMAVLRKAAVIEQQPSAVSNSQGLQQSGDNSKPRSLTEEIQHMQQLVVPAVDETAQEVTPEKTLAELDSVDEDQIATETPPEISVPETPIPTVKSESNVRKVTMEYVDQCLDLLQKLEQPVNALPGVGPKTEQALKMLGLFTLRDLLFHFPRSFVDRSIIETDIRNVPDGELGTFVLTVHRDQAKHNAVPCSDEAGNNVDIVFMYGKTRHFATAEKKKLLQSNKMVVSGKVSCSKSGYAIFNPDVIELVNNATDVLGIEPVYRLNSGLAQNKMRKIVDVALEVADELKILPESLPEDILEDLDWPSFVDAIKIAHKPTSMDGTGVNSPARNRLAFEELCMQQAQLALARWDMKYHGIEQQCISRAKTWRDSPLVAKAVQSLPFQLTESQMNCLDEIWNDAIVSNDGGRMTRLLQGDVGSGKTVLGYLAGLGCIESRQGGGSVVVMLAPTQLALQHYKTISDFANAFNEQYADSLNMGIRVELLTGSVVGSRREEVFSRLEDTGSDAVFLIGTHALVTTDVVERLRNLPSVIQSNDKGVALAIIDEEQRFGVNQRQALSSCAANTLFMTATPIPRSLGLHNSGLLDVTHLESEPRNVQTTITSTDNLEKVVSVLQTKIKNGSRCFWVLPRIGGNETDNDEDTSSGPSSVLDRHSMLTDIFGTETIGHVHGRMSVKDRETQLAKFSDTSSPTSILVSTTCIEVGIDIRDVDILIVENADRFGLSALHQLRGRIGRGSSDVNCHCILIAEEKHFNDSSSDSIKRLDILRETLSGEQVSAYDFEFRGPGDLMGRAQTGLLKGKAVNPEYHLDMLDAATWIGRAFSGVLSGGPVQNESSASQCSVLMKKLCTGELRSFYDQTSASSEQGFALRVMMALFANYQDDAGGGILQSITSLQRISEAKNDVSVDDDLVQQKIVSLLQSLPDSKNTGFIKSLSSKQIKPKRDEAGYETLTTGVDDSAEAPLSVSTQKVNLAGDDVVFIVLDVETTGLSYKTDHVIQIAAKVLGSSNEEDLFSEYILPPVQVPEKIEELTGIKDSFLRYGGFDDAPGKQRDGPARTFEHVFLSFQSFCKDRAQGKKLVLVAHNAKFDKGMINGELRRHRTSESSQELASSLSDVFDSSLDSLQLFRDKRMWKSFTKTEAVERPDSFKLGDIYHHVFREMLPNSHNAVGDIQALDRLLMEQSTFYGWKRIANDIQYPMSKVNMPKL